MPGVLNQPTACVAVFEKHPYWGPELHRQFATRGVLVRDCRSLRDLIPAVSAFASAAIVLDFDSSPEECLSWLSQQFREVRRHPVIACASSDLSGLEWSVREAGAICFVDDETTGEKLARLCSRQLRLP